MTLLWLDNFGYAGNYGSSPGETVSSLYSMYNSAFPYLYFPSGRTSTAGYLSLGYRAGISLDVSSLGQYSTLVIGYATYSIASGTGKELIIGDPTTRTTTPHCMLQTNTSDCYQIYNANNSVVETCSISVGTGIWKYVEVKIVLGDSTGSMEVRINGQQAASVSGQDFLETASGSYIDTITFHNSGTPVYWFSELYITDGDFLGPIRVRACFPDEDSATHTDFTPSSGSDHYAMVDETVQDNDTTYNTGSQEGDKDTYLFDTSSVVGPVKGAALLTRATRTGGSALKFKNMVRISSTDYDGSDEYYTDIDYDNYHQMWGVNPNTSNAWTTGEIASAEFGVHITGLSTTTTTA